MSHHDTYQKIPHTRFTSSETNLHMQVCKRCEPVVHILLFKSRMNEINTFIQY